MNPYDIPLPQDLDAEKALLGAMLLVDPKGVLNNSIADAIDGLGAAGAAAFIREAHQTLYAEIVALWRDDQSIDGVLIKDRLARRGLFDKLGGFEFLSSLICAAPASSRANEYAALVKDKWALRQTIAAVHRTLEACYADRATFEHALAVARREVEALGDADKGDRMTTFDRLVDAVLDAADWGKPTTTVRSGLAAIDEMTGGFAPGELWVVAGLRSAGKSALAAQIADHAANVDGVPTMLFALEDSRENVTLRLLAANATVSASDLRHRRALSADANWRLQEARARLRKKALAIDDGAGRSLGEIVAACRADHARRKTGLIVIDQLSHVGRDPGERYDRYDLELGAKTRRFKALAKQLECPLILCAQLNRESERAQRPPQLSDLRDSACIEHDADGVILVWGDMQAASIAQTQNELGGRVIETYERCLRVAKNRNGPTHAADPAKLRWTPEYQLFEDDVRTEPERPAIPADPPRSETQQTMGTW